LSTTLFFNPAHVLCPSFSKVSLTLLDADLLFYQVYTFPRPRYNLSFRCFTSKY